MKLLRVLDIGSDPADLNTAARMESSGIPGCIQVTDETCRLLARRYPFERREGVEIKGKGTAIDRFLF